MKTDLDTVPSFTYEQENGDGMVERPVTVKYYHGSIALAQGGVDILISWDLTKELFREIERHKDHALKELKS
jgi:hypothetical protein